MQQLSTAYDACNLQSDVLPDEHRFRETSASLPDLPVQYTDFSHWQRQQMQDGGWDGQIEYWKKQLAGIPEALDLPSDQIRPKSPSGEGHQLHIHIPGHLYRDIQACAAQQQATVLMVLASVFQVRPWVMMQNSDHARCYTEDVAGAICMVIEGPGLKWHQQRPCQAHIQVLISFERFALQAAFSTNNTH